MLRMVLVGDPKKPHRKYYAGDPEEIEQSLFQMHIPGARQKAIDPEPASDPPKRFRISKEDPAENRFSRGGERPAYLLASSIACGEVLAGAGYTSSGGRCGAFSHSLHTA